MGSGPEAAAKPLSCHSDIERAQYYCDHLQKRHGSQRYTLHDLTVFIYLNATLLGELLRKRGPGFGKRIGRGVYKKKDKSICAQITVNGKKRALGTFKTLAAANAKRGCSEKGQEERHVQKTTEEGGTRQGTLPSQGRIPSYLLLRKQNHSAPKCRPKVEARRARDTLHAKVGKALR